MRNVVKLSILLGFLWLPGITFAAAPFAYGGWDVGTGTINSACPAGVNNCEVVATGAGFLQRKVFDPALPQGAGGTSYYIQTIVTDPTATGTPSSLPLANESWVLITESNNGNTPQANENGIAAKQFMADTSTGTTFSTDTTINTGWAADANTPNVTVAQSMSEPPATGSNIGFGSNFNYQSTNDATTGAVTSYSMAIDQVTGLFSQGGDPNDQQKFQLNQAKGSLTAGSVQMGTVGAVSWGANDELRATWVGQVISAQGATAGDPFQGSTFGFNSIDNLSTATGVTDNSRTSTGPFAWPSVFTAPTFP